LQSKIIGIEIAAKKEVEYDVAVDQICFILLIVKRDCAAQG
jgi:hypothetical protein